MWLSGGIAIKVASPVLLGVVQMIGKAGNVTDRKKARSSVGRTHRGDKPFDERTYRDQGLSGYS